jgi:RND family efflux transporter MFP subunit
MGFSKRTLTVFTIILLAGLVGGGIWWRLRPEPEPEAAAAGDEDSPVQVASSSSEFAADVPQPVQGAMAIRDTLWITVNAAGRAEANRRAAVTSLVEGVIQEIPVRENARVRAGQTILQVDTLELALSLREAQAALADAQAQFEALTLFDDDVQDPQVRARRREVARSASGLNTAEVRLQQAQLQLERARVQAPFPGRIADLRVVEGAFVTAGTELMTVVELDPIKVEVQVLEAEVGYLQEGRRAAVTFAAFPGETFQGRIETINPVVDPEQRTGRVTVLLPNPEGRIKPGMYAEVSLDAQSFPDRILVPRAAILERGEGRRRNIVFVYEEEGGRGLAKWRYVTPGKESDRYVELVRGDEGIVEPGEIVLVDGHHYLGHDVRVRLVENVAAEGGRPGR